MREVKEIKLDEILIDEEWNCRDNITAMSIQTLAEKIQEHGLLQPIAVRTPNEGEDFGEGKIYKLVLGFRRSKAHQFLKYDTIRATILEGVSDEEAMVMNLSENIERKDLNILEEAKALVKIKHSSGIKTQDALAKRIGRTAIFVEVRLGLLDSPEAIQEAMVQGLMNQQEFRMVRRLPVEKQLITVRKIQEAVQRKEKVTQIVASATKPTKDQPRKRSLKDVDRMIEHIVDTLGTNPAGIALAWSRGNVSDNEFFEVMKENFPDFVEPDAVDPDDHLAAYRP